VQIANVGHARVHVRAAGFSDYDLQQITHAGAHVFDGLAPYDRDANREAKFATLHAD
jgi:hypothetical protein